MKKKKESHIDSATVFFAVIAGIIIMVGVIMKIIGASAMGITQPGKYGQGGGEVQTFSGTAVIVLVLLVAVLPLKDCLAYLIDRMRSKKDEI